MDKLRANIFLKYTIIFILFFLVFLHCSKIKVKPDTFKHQLATNWTMYGGNPARTNHYPGDMSLPLKLIWKYNASSAIGKTILVVDGIVFFNTKDGRIYALNIKDGDKLGHKKTEVDATSAYKDTSVYIAYRYGDFTLLKYNLKEAKIDWRIDAGDIASEPLMLDDGIVITALYKHIDFYSLIDGARIWQTKTDDQIRSSPAFNQGTIVFGCDDGYVYAVGEMIGESKWKFQTNASVQATPAIKDTIVYIGSSDYYFYAISLKTGKLVWKHKTNGQILHAPAVNDDIVIFGSTDSRLYCLNRLSGKEIWIFQAKSVISTSPLICKNTVFFGSLDQHYYAVNLETGYEIWKYKTRGRVRTAPVVWGKYLIGAAENNTIYAFSSSEEK